MVLVSIRLAVGGRESRGDSGAKRGAPATSRPEALSLGALAGDRELNSPGADE
jgi:hypothetical protein